MRFKMFVTLIILALACSTTTAAWQKKPSRPKTDPISGDWNTSLISDGNANGFSLTMKLKLDRDKVTGAYESDHVGSGNISKGSWIANKLSLALETNHGQIVLTGEMKQGNLAGKFNAGQMQGTWQANRK